MIKVFTDEVAIAQAGTKAAVRAHQAWQYLIGKAANRQTVRYGELTDLMEYNGDNRPVITALDCIMFYCEQHSLPSLTVIVVNKNGVPGVGYSAVSSSGYDREREKVFEYEWFKMMPPSVKDFRNAREWNKRR